MTVDDGDSPRSRVRITPVVFSVCRPRQDFQGVVQRGELDSDLNLFHQCFSCLELEPTGMLICFFQEMIVRRVRFSVTINLRAVF